MIRLGMIGTGRIAQRFVQEAKKTDGLRINGIFHPRWESARHFAKLNGGLPCTAQWEEFIEAVDAVYIAAPHRTHKDYAKAALEAGKHVLCEKPMALCRADLDELFKLAEEKDCVLMEAVKTAYCPGFLAMMEMAKSGRIGHIRDVEACFTRLTPTNLRELTDTACGGSLTEFGSYTLLPILRLLGTDYQKVEYRVLDAPNGVDAYAKVILEYQDAMGLSKTGLMTKSEGQLVIAGTKGYILAESPWWLTRKFEVRYEDPDRRETFTYPYEGSGLQYELKAFLERIENGKDPAKEHLGPSREESAAMAAVMEGLLRERSRKLAAIKTANAREGRTSGSHVKIWAHRGCSMAYPENTLMAFQAAAKLPGITGIELDIQLSKDGEVVVFHDESLLRVTGREGKVGECTLAELRALSFKGVEPGESDALLRIPTLGEVLELLKPYCEERGLLINIELKTSIVRYPGIEQKALELVRQFHLEPFIVWSSFLPESVRIMKELSKEARTGILCSSLEACLSVMKEVPADALHPWIGGLDCRIPDSIKGMPIRAWNGEEPFFRDGRILRERNLLKYTDFGVTDFFTNVPENYLTEAEGRDCGMQRQQDYQNKPASSH